MTRWQDFTIRELLVHRPPMLLLDEVVDYGHDHLVARLTVAADGVFVSAGSVPALLCFEYMAQAIAAHRGIADRLAGREPQVGLVLGSRELLLSADRLVDGAPLLVRVESDFLVGGALVRYRGTVIDESTSAVLARADMKAFQAGDMEAFLLETPL